MDRYSQYFIPPEKTYRQKLRKSFFKTHHEKGYPYFSSTRVGSCSHIKIKNGRCVAIPFYIINRRGRSLNHFKTVPDQLYINKSTYMYDYIPRKEMHCGMKKKPLLPYSMYSSRSQLPINTFLNGVAVNRSCLELGDNKLINRKQWKTSYRDFFRKPNYVPVSNIGILSDMAKAAHSKLTAF